MVPQATDGVAEGVRDGVPERVGVRVGVMDGDGVAEGAAHVPLALGTWVPEQRHAPDVALKYPPEKPKSAHGTHTVLSNVALYVGAVVLAQVVPFTVVLPVWRRRTAGSAGGAAAGAASIAGAASTRAGAARCGATARGWRPLARSNAA